MRVFNNGCFMERVHLQVWTTKRQEYLTLKDEGYVFKVGKMSISCKKIKSLQCVALNKQAHTHTHVKLINLIIYLLPY